MATFEKLRITGIRSFGCSADLQSSQQIKFDTPVTLIVGQNGCGKTTILESIKYACTSDLPAGSSKGQGFVHDPKLSEKTTTKGQILLKLKDVNGDTYTIVRCVQLQQKATGLSFTSLDSALSVLRANGDKQQITGRCADIDKQCAEILQVSPCILNNVLFCHQENSSWPLEEGKKLKEKFDEIFDSQKYNKCGDLLLKVMKKHTDKLKTLRLAVDVMKEKKQEVSNRKIYLQEKKDKCNSIIEKIREKNSALDPHRIRLTEIEELERDLGELQNQQTSRVAERKNMTQQQTMLKQRITKVFEGTDEELNGEISTFENKQKEKQRVIQELEEKKRGIEQKENVNDKEIQRMQIKLGQLREEKKQYELKTQQLNSLFEKAKLSLEIKENIEWNTQEETRSATRLLQLKLKETDDNLENKIKSHRDAEQTLQDKIDKAREAVATIKQKIQSNSQEIKNTDMKILQVKNEIQDLEIANQKLHEIAKSIENLTQTLQKLQSKFDESASEIEIENIKKDIEQMERSLKELEDLYKILQHNYIIEEKLNVEEQTQIKKKTEINKIKNKHSENFKHIFGNNIPNDNVGKRIQTTLNANEKEMKKINNEITVKQKQITKLETQINHERQEIKKQEHEIETKISEINSICKDKDFTTFLRETYAKKEKLQKDKGHYSSAQAMYEKFIEVFDKDSPCCPICETDFSNKKSVTKAIIEKLKQTIKKLPEKLMDTERKLRQEEQIYNKLQQLKPVSENLEIIQNVKLPLLNEQLETNTNNLKQLNEELDKLNIDLKIPTKNFEISRSLITDATLLDQYNADLRSCEEKIKQYRSQIKKIETTKNKHEVESEIENLKADLSDNRKKYETLRLKLDQHKRRCQSINDEKNQKIQEQLKYQTQANKKPHLEEQLEDLNDNYQVLLVVKEEQQIEYKKYEEDLGNLNREKANLTNNNRQVINKEREIVSKNHQTVDNIEKLNIDIKQYQEKDLTRNLQQAIEDLTKLEEKRKDFAETKNKAVNKITEQREQIAKQCSELRDLQDNVTLREKQKQETVLIQQIKELEQRIGKYNYRSVREEKVKLKQKIDSVEKEINSLKGQEMELKNTISDIEMELNMPRNKNVEKNYKDKFYEYKVTELVINDLRKYQRALHCSILEFHRERMVLINQRIRELWREIYKGNDIDYIEIRADISKGHNPSKQTYDYKVVQVKNLIELEMRGRCSAGQRVLGCLIIRMALAESFSANCGIMALDEPTTNLDKENVSSLSSALANIITSHEKDQHFQLLVITHDQDFLDTMRHNIQNISHYWRVSRTPQGLSIIKKEYL